MHDFNEFELHTPASIFQEGMDLLESDHFEEALGAFEFVARREPYNADALFHRGIALVNLGRFDDAVASYDRALLIAPTEPLFLTHCGYAHMVAGRHDTALEHFDRALQIAPDSPQAKVYKACVLAERRQLGDARALLEEVLRDNGDEPETMRHYAAVLAAVGEEEKALEQYARLLKLNPNHIEAISRRAVIFMRQGKREEAVRCFREIVALSPNDPKPWITLLELLSGGQQFQALIATATDAIANGIDNAEVYFYRGRALMEERQTDAAINDLRRSRLLNEKNHQTHFLMARALAQRGRIKRAIISINQALLIVPEEKAYLLMKAGLHHKIGDYDTELECLTALTLAEPSNYQYAKLKADNQSGRGLHAAACKTIERFLRRSPTHRRALLHSARLHELNGDMEAARAAYDAVMQKPSRSPRECHAYAGFILRRGETENALELLDRGTRDFPEEASLQTYRALALQSLGRHLECAAHLRAFVTTGQATAETYWLLGVSHHALRRYTEALANFEQARQMETRSSGGDAAPSFRFLEANAYTLHHLRRTGEGIRLLEKHSDQYGRYQVEYYCALGELYEFIGAFGKAQILYGEGARAHPENANLHYRLARAAAALGRKRLAVKHLSAAIVIKPELADTAAAEQYFQQFPFSLSMNRLVGFRFIRRKATLAGLIGAWMLMVLLASLFFSK